MRDAGAGMGSMGIRKSMGLGKWTASFAKILKTPRSAPGLRIF
jgi:hypothetical protein